MRRNAKASTAGSNQRRAMGLGRILRGTFVTRGASADADGSSASAPSHRGRLALLSLAALAFTGLVLLVASAFGSKEVIDYIGVSDNTSADLGEEFSNPRDVAVNRTGAGPAGQGDIYVADQSFDRIQRFDSEGNFVSAWGANVVTEPVNEVQTLSVEATGGTYVLSFGGAETGAIAYDASSATVDNALDVLPGIDGNSNVVVSGSAEAGFTITFAGALAATNVPQVAVNDDELSGAASTAHPTQGFGAYEICTVAANCLEGRATGAPNFNNDAKNGTLDDPQSVAVDNDTGNVYVSDRDNRRVNEYTGDGAFIRSFGWDVAASGPGDTGTEYEICEQSEGDVCKKGVGASSPGVGQFHTSSTSGAYGIAVSPQDGEAAVGKVFLANTGDEHVNTYDLDGENPAEFGSSTEFGSNQPRNIAVDSRGIVYASNSKNSGEIERYDTENANGGGIGFLEPITAENSTPAGPLLGGSNSGGNATNATSGLAVDPDTDEAGPDVDELYALRDPSSSFGGNVTRVQQLTEPGLTAPPAAIADEHGAGAGFAAVQGFGLDDEGERLFISSSSGVSGLDNTDRVYILEENVAPEATLDPITEFDAHSAIFSGTADPNGFYVNYRFEYVDDAEFQANGFENAAQVPIADANAGNGEAPAAVENQTPDHLVPGTEYHVRLVAKQVFSSVEAISGPQTFTTDSSAPTFTTAATVTGIDEATLRAAINPENEAVTDYHFEWGTSESYGNTTPVGNLASGTDPVAVSEELTGLTPGVTYHYQLVATNGTGTTTGPDQTLTTLAQQLGLGPERAYEIASHYPTGGVPIIPTVAESDVSPDGNHIIFDSVQPLPGSVAPLADQINWSSWVYKSDRGGDSWGVTQTKVARDGPPWGTSIDLTHQVTGTNVGLDPDDQNGVDDLYQRQPDGTFVWISRDPRIPVGTPQTASGGAGVGTTQLSPGTDGNDTPWSLSDDGSTVVFKSARPLLDIDPGGAGSFNLYLYKWQNGQLSFVGQRPNGSVVQKGFTALGTRPASTNGGYRDTVSRDGSRVIWGAPRDDVGGVFGGGKSLYVQIDGQPTVEAVKETGVSPLPNPQPYRVQYWGAATNATRVFFGSSSRLTPDSGASVTSNASADADLYVYDVAADKVRDLTPRLDGVDDSAIDPATSDRGGLRGVSSVSADGKRAYFVADAQYDVAPNPFGQLPSAGGRNLYLAELDGIDDPIDLRFVAAMGTGDQFAWQPTSNGKMAHANPDGSVLSFASTENLTAQPTGGLRQLFVYDAERDTLECASCPSNGSLPSDEVNRFPKDPTGFTYGFRFQHAQGDLRWTSSGGTVFFDTVTPLTPDDQNTTDDVYEYRAGEVRLISGGTGSNPSKIENASVDGSSVFFTAADALVPQDEEPGVTKIYAAREGGGFPNPPKLPSCDINAGACEGKGTSAPDQPGAGSAQFSGSGNIDESKQNRCKRLARAARRLAARAQRLRRAARRAGTPKRAKVLRRKARRYQKAAGKRSAATKRCRSGAARAANTNRRAGR